MKQISAGGVVLNSRNQIVVVNQNHDSWSLPKGHLDAGETLLEAAKREIYEETGLSSLEYLAGLGQYERPRIARGGGDDPREIKQIHLFLFSTLSEVLNPVDPQNPEARWVAMDEVCDYLTHPQDRVFFDSVKDKIRSFF